MLRKTDGGRRRARRGPIVLLSLCLLLAPTLTVPTVAAPSSQAAPEPIEGIWTQLGFGYPSRIEVVATGSGSFVGTVLESAVDCLPVGLEIWHLQGSGTSYTGTVFWYESNCSERGQGETEWTINDDGTMRFCSIDPKDPNRTDCVDFGLAKAVVLSGPEFVERAERFDFDVEIRGVESCAGLEIALLKEVGGTFGIIKKVEPGSCDLTIKQRLRRDATFKARIAGEPSTDSPSVTVKVR